MSEAIKAIKAHNSDAYDIVHTGGNYYSALAAQEPVGWLYDWVSDSGTVRDWFSQDYEEAHSPTNQCHNIRPLYTHPAPQQPAQAAQGDALTDTYVQQVPDKCERCML